MVKELASRAKKEIGLYRPDALFVFKGNYVTPSILESARGVGARTVNYYPDVSFHTHGRELPRTLPHYDHVFNAKTFGVADMQAHGVKSVSFLPPGFDPDVHRPVAITDADASRFSCDVSFIGTWSPKKERILTDLRARIPGNRLRIWGNQWEKRTGSGLDGAVMGMGVTGDDYARAICASKISLGLLSEARAGASSGDLITARTFQIPACGAFMLHERTREVTSYFTEDEEVALYETPAELAEKVTSYLADDARREAIARRGHERSIRSDYSIDARMRVVAEWISKSLRERR